MPNGKVSPIRFDNDVVRYNKAAAEIMQEQKIAVNDLYAFALQQLNQIQQPANVHFTDEGSIILGKEVARHIKDALK